TEEEAKSDAVNIVAFETKMAEPRMTKEERRDARKRFNPKSMDEMKALTPSIDWKDYFDGIGAKDMDTVIVTDLGYFKALDGILKESSVDDWKNYLRWTLLNRASNSLSTDIETASWEFYSKTLRGSKEQRPAEERALGTINRTMGEALGKLYVDEKFPPEAKEKAKKMIENIMLAFEKRIDNLEWMTPETKEKAKEKLRKMNVKIAYPDQWKDYSDLAIVGTKDGGSYFSNMRNVAQWNYNDDMQKLGKPVDKSEWHMSPQTVNA
ncbi:MAG: M13 family metallopeptidase, partial [Mangrovimonas sp.]|nr:M13 family metallopeptidase [Mangrovimonas sp.]